MSSVVILVLWPLCGDLDDESSLVETVDDGVPLVETVCDDHDLGMSACESPDLPFDCICYRGPPPAELSPSDDLVEDNLWHKRSGRQTGIPIEAIHQHARHSFIDIRWSTGLRSLRSCISDADISPDADVDDSPGGCKLPVGLPRGRVLRFCRGNGQDGIAYEMGMPPNARLLEGHGSDRPEPPNARHFDGFGSNSPNVLF